MRQILKQADDIKIIQHILHLVKSEAVKVVSFDIFDTAISRIFLSPADLFLSVEKTVNFKMNLSLRFASQRIEAEIIARQRAGEQGRPEIFLDEIYSVLCEFGFTDVQCAAYKDEEIRCEIASVYPVRIIQELYNQLRVLGIPVVFTSDIYLPEDVICTMLARCGYEGYTALFISNVLGASKAQGNLFVSVLDYLEKRKILVDPQQLIHIGDNDVSDRERAASYGIQAFHVHAPAERFIMGGSTNRYYAGAHLQLKPALESSIVQGLIIKQWAQQTSPDTALHDIGFRVVGPMLYGFANWLHRQCQESGYQNIFFLARDGLIFKAAFDRITASKQSCIGSEYIFASRRCLYFPSISEFDTGAQEFLTKLWNPIQAYELITRIGIDIATFRDDIERIFGSIHTIVKPDDSRITLLFQQIFPKLLPMITEERRLLMTYLASKGVLNDKVAICDIGYRGSMQAAIKKLAIANGKEIDIKGYYLATFAFSLWNDLQTKGYLCDQSQPNDILLALQESIPVLELFFSAQHGSILRLRADEDDGIHPVYIKPSVQEELRFDISRSIQKGALDFVDAVLECDLGYDIAVDAHLAIAGWKAFIKYPSLPELEALKQVMHNDGMGDSSFVPIIKKIKLLHLLLRPQRTLEGYYASLWPQGCFALSSSAVQHVLGIVIRLGHKMQHLKTRFVSI